MNITKILKISVVGIGGNACGSGSLKASSQEFKNSNYRLNFILTTPYRRISR